MKGRGVVQPPLQSLINLFNVGISPVDILFELIDSGLKHPAGQLWIYSFSVRAMKRVVHGAQSLTFHKPHNVLGLQSYQRLASLSSNVTFIIP